LISVLADAHEAQLSISSDNYYDGFSYDGLLDLSCSFSFLTSQLGILGYFNARYGGIWELEMEGIQIF
jgi:hypothetical protein